MKASQAVSRDSERMKRAKFLSAGSRDSFSKSGVELLGRLLLRMEQRFMHISGRNFDMTKPVVAATWQQS